VATGRNHALTEEEHLQVAYFGDTWGNLYRYVPQVSGPAYYTGTCTVSLVEGFTCNHPLHYAPTVVQLDRDGTTRAGEIYLIQVTSSTPDLDTKSFPASKMIFRRDLATSAGTVTSDSSFGVGGTVELTVGVASQMRGETSADGKTCLQTLPAAARPNSTPHRRAARRRPGVHRHRHLVRPGRRWSATTAPPTSRCTNTPSRPDASSASPRSS
jgi:hypothetical protein